jgi:hypothetical protein
MGDAVTKYLVIPDLTQFVTTGQFLSPSRRKTIMNGGDNS